MEFFFVCVTNKKASTLLCSVVKDDVSGYRTKEMKGEKLLDTLIRHAVSTNQNARYTGTIFFLNQFTSFSSLADSVVVRLHLKRF